MIKTFLRKWRLRLGKLLFDQGNKNYNSEDIEKILFIRYDGKIGDYIISSFMFREIKKQRPEIKIHAVVHSSNLSLYQNNEYIDKIFILSQRNYIPIIRLALQLKKQNYDTLFDSNIQQKNRDLLLIRLTNAKINLGYCKENYNFFQKNVSYQRDHLRVVLQKMLQKIGIEISNLYYDLPYDAKSEQNVETFFKEKNIKNPISLNWFGDHFNKKFDQKNALKLLNILQTKIPNQPIIILIYPQVKEKVKSWLKNVNLSDIFIYEKTEQIEDNIEIIKKSIGLITPDTSLIHIASALGIKILGFYDQSPKTHLEWSPVDTEYEMIFYKKTVNDINFSEVEQKIQQLFC